MAYWALYKWFKPWRKLPTYDVIYYFSEYVVKTPEQRQIEAEQRKKRLESTKNVIRKMAMMTADWGEYSYLMGRLLE